MEVTAYADRSCRFAMVPLVLERSVCEDRQGLAVTASIRRLQD
jgi:hypothetical protein